MVGLREALRELLRLPGSHYSCVADPATGRVLEEMGAETGSGASGAVLGWGADAARYLTSAAADDLEDLMITSRRAYHLVRQIESASGERLLVYLCLDRARGNLAVARRELAAARLDEQPSGASRLPIPVPVQAASPAAERVAGTLFGPSPARAAAVVPAPPVPRPRPAEPIAALPRRAPAALPPPPLPAAAAPAAGRQWANDVGTMRRLLAGLRKLA
ncbi:hypothetical protein [Pseudonocardia aurantiaca]|uniref:Roadblock/LAMTOR2 domain-containing protein n=1 Tax=Pseudonocardia aurantiaca TaxID=75290 RepID=A0ABW4FXF9_9PSEU